MGSPKTAFSRWTRGIKHSLGVPRYQRALTRAMPSNFVALAGGHVIGIRYALTIGLPLFVMS